MSNDQTDVASGSPQTGNLSGQLRLFIKLVAADARASLYIQRLPNRTLKRCNLFRIGIEVKDNT